MNPGWQGEMWHPLITQGPLQRLRSSWVSPLMTSPATVTATPRRAVEKMESGRGGSLAAGNLLDYMGFCLTGLYHEMFKHILMGIWYSCGNNLRYFPHGKSHDLMWWEAIIPMTFSVCLCCSWLASVRLDWINQPAFVEKIYRICDRF